MSNGTDNFLHDAFIKVNGPDTSTAVLVSDRILLIFTVMNFVIICKVIDIFGTVTNIINIVIFVKIGFKDPVNISLLGLAISDLGSCVTLIFLTICVNPLFQQLDLPFDPEEIHYLTSGWPHGTFSRVTSCITAFITFERCLCVVVPLKVKTLITPRRVTVFLVFVFLAIFASVAPVFYTTRHGWKFYPDKNKSLIGLVFTEDRDKVDRIAFTIHSITIPVIVFITVVLCTAILVVSLKRKTKWREKAANSAAATSSSRDTKVSKMVATIAVLFIICFVPVFALFIGMVVVPGFSINGKYRNLFLTLFSYHFTLESTNSAMNIFIYYKMSSNYRETFDRIFRRKKISLKTDSKK